ncbi:MAG TPA: deoxyribonuclease IV [Gaiellaceae bacterium]
MFFGAHVSSLGGIHKTLDRAEAMRADAVQLFTQSPRMWRPTDHDPANLEAFKERRAELGIAPGGVLSHAIYLVNLAAPDDEIYEKSRAVMRNTMEVARAIEADGVVFHVGSHLGAGLEVGLARCVPALQETLELCTDTTWLLLEDSAGGGGTIGRSIEELAALFDACGAHERLGLCLDTCHLYVSGVDITNREVVDDLLREVDERIGLDRLRALHVNDAVDPLGSNRDRHANIGKGQLGSKLGVFLSHPKLQGLPAFLEVPGPDKEGPDAKELRKARNLHKRWVATAG